MLRLSAGERDEAPGQVTEVALAITRRTSCAATATSVWRSGAWLYQILPRIDWAQWARSHIYRRPRRRPRSARQTCDPRHLRRSDRWKRLAAMQAGPEAEKLWVASRLLCSVPARYSSRRWPMLRMAEAVVVASMAVVADFTAAASAGSMGADFTAAAWVRSVGV